MSVPSTLSLCMIVRDEEKVLERCLQSVYDLVDEIIIVDTGSTDRTKQIAKKFTDSLYHFQWIDDFAAARNYSFAQSTKDYILWLDADDVLLEPDRLAFQELRTLLDGTIDRVTMPYHLTTDLNGNVGYSLRRNRIVRRNAGFQWFGRVHEYLEVSGNAIDSDVAITHKSEKSPSSRNLMIYRTMQKNQEPFTPRDTLYFANELMYNGQKENAIIEFEKFLSSQRGWKEDNIIACLNIANCYKGRDDKKRLSSLFQTFEYDLPRAEACIEIGQYFIEQEELEKAIYWLELIFFTKKPETLGMLNQSAWTWAPLIQLTYCYDRIGQSEKAYEKHKQAKALVPDHPSVLLNEAYFLSHIERNPYQFD
ncbi:beta 1,4 glucosyltransferase [Sporosarcina sp. NCCP-2222]|uniref:tetratricopeptide repeat-containing glycosyltransferase family 2 protein n=1 Tax=Sporosarcina sp. NCCP-2222 TaxID=2935073 RepID=UPI0020832C62|nr:glycosyltransferase family 2 protein [Sporosarcina sp. NCCP-2222]GKV57677.1 beta 1,4 glucosyltransferase [Sporosarcina sp. NCCP-2222]